jgi:hypothetical protein
MHSAKRVGAINMYSDGYMKAYNDAGLNTFGLTVGLVRLTNPYGANLVFTASFIPSYHNPTIPKIQYRLQGETNWNIKEMDTIPANAGQVTRSTRFIWLDLTTDKTIEVRPVNSNEEGDTYGGISTYPMMGRQYTYFITMTDACGNPSTNSGTITTSDYTLAIGASLNGTGGTLIPNGHFTVSLDIDDEDLANVGGLVYGMHNPDGSGWKILDRKQIGWCTNEPAPPQNDWYIVNYFYYSSDSWSTACALIHSHPEVIGTSRVLYFRKADSKYYTSAPTNVNGLPPTATRGLYYKSSEEFFLINVDGTHGGDGNCTSGLIIEEV